MTRIPRHCRHKSSGQGFVRLNGRMIYTGIWGFPEADRCYERLISEWLANGKQAAPAVAEWELRVDKLVALYWTHAESYYRHEGVPTLELDNIKLAVRPLVELYGTLAVVEFGPRKLKALREHMIEKGLARTTINSRIGIVQRMFRWGAEEEFIPGTLADSVRSVRSLQKHRSRARETAPVTPVSEADFRAVLPCVTRQVAGMAEIQWLTGMRPGEITQMRWKDIEKTDGEGVWIYRPERHKTQHLGKDRVIPLGPRAQKILRGFKKLDSKLAIFSPADADADFRVRKHTARRSPMTPSHRRRHEQAMESPKQEFFPEFDTRTYARAIARGCKKAGVTHWSPNQLRHSAGTRIRRASGLDAARALLGHSSPSTTEIYAELDLGQAARLMEQFG